MHDTLKKPILIFNKKKYLVKCFDFKNTYFKLRKQH